MTIRIELLSEKSDEEYEEMHRSVEHSLLCGSVKYRNFLKRVIVQGEPQYLVAYEANRLVGGFPLFLKRNQKYGNVLNSLPFFGSNGGIVVSDFASKKDNIKKVLLEGMHSLAEQESVVTSTIVSNPLANDADFYESHACHSFRDKRIGQVSPLPVRREGIEELQYALFEMFHQKTRNCIRKAQKSGIVVTHSGSLEAMEILASLHRQNLEAIGGLVKTWSVFKTIRETFVYDQDYRVYLAHKDGVAISALLVFFYNYVAEYFTPASLESARIYQPMSLLVYEGMQEAVCRGCRHWNWGGTWLTQPGVYQFKSRWGTVDHPYHYYIREYDEHRRLRQLERRTLLEEYPYFYVIPYDALISAGECSK